ncbi:WASH complex subunit 2 isoform X3 [Gouania willdenowi]|uniref:WASH complex subunit 2 isoform X3 n=1 Tax=Gouania willdenowi TaxID=441366 RepID=UPI0010558475|nr:WASH complex subunit 2-like isoform X3 [Gouania willdenowi]
MSGLPEGMANGHCRGEHLDKDGRIWERPWTIEEMRQNGTNWSLAADSGLFLFLQDFSQRMLSKTHEIEKQLDSLIRDTKATDSCLHSVFNDFLMLSNTQFIENRVYDEEIEETVPKAEASEKQPEQEKTREQKEAELIPKMQEAVNYGLGVLESAFEHLDMKAGNSDSEEEDIMDRVEPILEPKDLYVDRPLPYLIGSQAFMEHEDVGLGDLSSDEMSVDSDRDSVIESEDEKETDQSDEDYDPEEEEPMQIKKKSSMMSYEDDEDSDIFGESDKDDDDDDDDNAKITGPSSFADELAARIKGESINKPEGDRASFTSKKKSKGRKEHKSANPQGMEDDSDDMFKPPRMDEEEFSPFGGKSGLFSGGKGLFSDDDEGDLFSEAPKPPESEEKKAPEESRKHTSQATETNKPGKKIPAGAVSIFPGNSLFSSGNESDTEESKGNETPALTTNNAPKQVLLGAGNGGGGGGGLFDEDDEDDDFFSGKNLKRTNTAGQEKPKPPKAIDLFDDDEDGDIFGDRAHALNQSKTETVKEQIKPPEKKMPAGAISLFGPGTESLLSEGLKKRQQSTSEKTGRSEENSSAPDFGPSSSKQNQKTETRGLFSDDEDAQVFPTITKSQSNPESTNQSKTNKAPLSLFDDEEEEDLFAYAAKTKPTPSQSKASMQQPSKATSSSLFSDDEDQWISSKSSSTKTETSAGGMKSSVSAPTNLLSTKVTPKSNLFDDKDDDLFAPSNASSHKKPQRVALLFEDENDGEKGSLFGITSAINTSPVAPAKQCFAQTPDVTSQVKATSHPTSKEKLSEPETPPVRTPEGAPVSQSADSSESKKKPAGAVHLFGGIDVLGSKLTKNPPEEAEDDGLFLPKDSSPKSLKKDKKLKTTSVSLFDDDDVEAESDSNTQIFVPSKPAAQKTLKPTEDQPQAKSTGVFQDEELLFSQTQQKDNDPDVDLFATSGKAASSKANLVKPAAQSLFSDEDEDDLFGSVKQKVPPLVPSKPANRAPLASPDPISENQKPTSDPVKPKDSSSRIGKLQASLKINTAALLPGAAASLPGAVGVLPTMGPSSSSGVSSSSLSPSPLTSPAADQPDSETGVSFDVPVQVSTLQSAQKRRAKGSVHRRPQSRSARQQAAQTSMEDKEETIGGDTPVPNSGFSGLVPQDNSISSIISPPLPNSAAPTALSTSSNSQPSNSEIPPRQSDSTLPVSTNAGKKDSKVNSSKVLPSSDEEDLFASDGLFGATSATTTPSPQQTSRKSPPQASSVVGLKKENGKSTLSSIFDDDTDDLFQKVKPRPSTKTAKVSDFMEEKDDDDIFGLSNSSTPAPTSAKEIQNSSSFSKHDIFQDDVPTVPKVHKKHKEKTANASLFSENIDIFADLSDTLKPKQKSKTKGETKSIFDDDMDDIFSSSTVKAVAAAPRKSKKSPPAQEAAKTAEPSNIFDDPLNVLGGN